MITWTKRLFKTVATTFLAGCLLVGCGKSTGDNTVVSIGNRISEPELIPAVTANWTNQYNLSSTGDINIPVFVVDFPDCTYADTVISGKELYQSIFGENDSKSVTSFYKTSSYGNLNITGDVYTYTASKNIAEYEAMEDEGYEALIMEMFEALDDDIEFSDYDSNEDSVLDTFIVCIPTGGDVDYWYGSQHVWYTNDDFSVDGIYPDYYVLCDSQADSSDIAYFQKTLWHELGHCMGLPDYYLYGVTDDYDGMHGIAGYEVMDDMEADFCQFSKIQLGWLNDQQVQVYDYDDEEESYFIPAASQGGCLVIFKEGTTDTDNFQSEYFVVEYDTPTGNFEGYFSDDDAGIRIIHADAETTYDGYYYDYKYNGYSEYYGDGEVRVIRRVNDSGDFFKVGDTISYGEKDFKWYNDEGDYKISITMDDYDENGAWIRISSN